MAIKKLNFSIKRNSKHLTEDSYWMNIHKINLSKDQLTIMVGKHNLYPQFISQEIQKLKKDKSQVSLSVICMTLF